MHALCIENTKETDFHKCGQGQWEETTIGRERVCYSFCLFVAAIAPGEGLRQAFAYFGSVQCSKGKGPLLPHNRGHCLLMAQCVPSAHFNISF